MNGSVEFIIAPRGQLLAVLAPAIAGGRIVAVDATAGPDRLRRLEPVAFDD